MWITIIFALCAFFSIFLLILYRRQIHYICCQLQFIEKNDTNKLIGMELNYKEIKELVDSINGIRRKEKLLESECLKKEEHLKETITNISHDIRTPLTSLKGYFELLKECGDEKEKERYIQIIEARMDSLYELVEQLFTYAKLQDESYKMIYQECNLNNILLNSMFAFYDDFKQKHIEPIIQIPEETSFVWANEAGIKRTLHNIIKNALDHGKESISIDMKSSQESVFLSFKNKYDSDEAIDVEQVFTRFYKGDQSRNSSSTGLGLSIAYELVKVMCGNISAYMEEDYFVIQVEFRKYDKK